MTATLGRTALLAPAAAVALVATTFGVMAELPGIGIALAAAVGLAWGLNGRVAIDPFAQGIGTLAAVLAAVAFTLLAFAGRPAVEQVMLGCGLVALAIAVFRIAQAEPRHGQRGTVALGLIPLIVAGVMPAATVYLIAVIGYVLLALATLVLEDPAEPLPGRVSARRAGGLAAFIGIATLTSAGLIVALPALHHWALRHALSGDYSRTAFGGHFQLGSLSRIMTSERLALRIRGTAPGYLRGTVYAFYHHGTWSAAAEHLRRALHVPTLDGLERDAGWVWVERLADRGPGLPLPLSAAALATPSGDVHATPAGIVMANPEHPVERYAYRPGPTHLSGISAPQPGDLAIPEHLAAPLTGLASSWTRGATDTQSRIGALRRRLQGGYRYALSRDGTPDEDPVIDFLLRNPVGHCEYFASAMTLLARATGTPARVVGGYLVTERNPYGNFYVARERDAHAWSEIWWDGAWHTVDATPPGAVLTTVRGATSWQRAVAEYLAAQAAVWIDDLGDGVLYLVVGVLGLALVVLRIRALRALRGGPPQQAAALVPLPCYELVAAHLAERGLARHPAETLHAYADRLRTSGHGGFADWLLAYAALRYGRIGSETLLQARARTLLAAGVRGGP